MFSLISYKRKQENPIFMKPREGSNLDTGQVICCSEHFFFSIQIQWCLQCFYQTFLQFAREALGVNMSVCWLWVVRLLLQCLRCMNDSCKYFVQYILLFFHIISSCSSCLEAQAHCTVRNVIDLWHVYLWIHIQYIIIFFCPRTWALKQSGQFGRWIKFHWSKGIWSTWV